MKSIGILNQDTDLGLKGTIIHSYEGEPAPADYSRAETCTHVQVPQELENYLDCVDIEWDEENNPVLVLDQQKKQAKDQSLLVAGIQNTLDKAISFGNQLIKDITIENMMLGITQDGKTGAVRKALTDVLVALQTGSLYDAIEELKSIPEEAMDEKYITESRLLSAVNKIEVYLGLPESEEL